VSPRANHGLPHAVKRLIAVGVGNTSLQIGYFDHVSVATHLAQEIPVPTTHMSISSRSRSWECLREAIPDEMPHDTPWYVASVFKKSATAIEEWVAAEFPAASFHMLSNQDFPIRLDVDHPARVGTDRVSVAVSVNRLRTADRPVIFIDAGTAITVNALDSSGAFLGGAILPGTSTSSRALAKSTDQLPEIHIESSNLPSPIGKNTEDAITSGIFWGSVGAVKELVDRITEEAGFESPLLIVTGGFGPALAKHLGKGATYNAHLVLSGIVLAVTSSV